MNGGSDQGSGTGGNAMMPPVGATLYSGGGQCGGGGGGYIGGGGGSCQGHTSGGGGGSSFIQSDLLVGPSMIAYGSQGTPGNASGRGGCRSGSSH